MRTLPQRRTRTATYLCERLLERYYQRRGSMTHARRVRSLRQIVLVLRYGWTHTDQILRYRRTASEGDWDGRDWAA